MIKNNGDERIYGQADCLSIPYLTRYGDVQKHSAS
jgi:hypothetical protein